MNFMMLLYQKPYIWILDKTNMKYKPPIDCLDDEFG